MNFVLFRCAAACAARSRSSTASHTWRARGVALVLGGSALACATYKPRPLVPADELAALSAQTPQAVRITFAQIDAAGAATPRQFDERDGLDEAEVVALALTLSPRLRAERLALGEAAALSISSGLLPNPEIGVFARRGIDGSAGTALGLEALFALLRADERPAQRAVAEAELDIARAELAAEELCLASAVRHARIAVLAADVSLRALRRESALHDSAVELVARQRELGEAAQTGVALVELERASILREVRAAEADLERARSELGALVGIPPASELELARGANELVFTILPEPSDDDIDARLCATSPSLRTSAANYRLAEEELRLAIARQAPLVRLGPAFERDVEGSESLGLGASIELPLFDRNQREIAARTAARETRRAEYAADLAEARARAHRARATLRRAQAEVTVEEHDVQPLVERTEALFEAAFKARELSVFEWLAARARTLRARRDQLAALVQYAHAVVELDAVLGARFVDSVVSTPNEESGS